MDWITSPEINAQVAEYFGEAPAQTKACDFTKDKAHCDIYHATDEKFAEQIHYWTTPQNQVRRRQRRQLHLLPGVGGQVAADEGLVGPTTASIHVARA